MSYTVEATFTKPADAKWFSQTHPQLAKKFGRVDKARAIGLQSRTVNKVDDNTLVITSVWATEADYRNYVTKKGTSVADAMRAAYAQSNNITASIKPV